MPEAAIRCPQNSKLRCWIVRLKYRRFACPFEDRGFMEALEAWAYTNRTPRSVAIGIDPACGGESPGDCLLVEQAEMYCNFTDGSAVWEVVTRNKKITKAICKDMIAGLKLWRRKRALEEI